MHNMALAISIALLVARPRTPLFSQFYSLVKGVCLKTETHTDNIDNILSTGYADK